ncbi:unnamed protein product [Dibothriocephalus latus]|uniref:Reverse transcriptase domain-containing protein n=1 Tax=Dibothriocephalus latus TaxID=60516 RepID=A0A3P7LC36_DIBLA|nr:unnamed protein product [Dibothriocephalus latus]
MAKAYFRFPNARGLFHRNLSHPFNTRSGIRQGFIVSSTLLNYAIMDGSVVFAPGYLQPGLEYSDNIALLAPSFNGPRFMVSWANTLIKSVGLFAKFGKTNVFLNCLPHQSEIALEIDGCQFEEVNSFKLLRVRLLSNSQDKDGTVSLSILLFEFSKALESI